MPKTIKNCFYEPLCIEVLQHNHRAEPVVVVRIAIRNVRVKHTRIATIIAIASAFDKRIVGDTV